MNAKKELVELTKRACALPKPLDAQAIVILGKASDDLREKPEIAIPIIVYATMQIQSFEAQAAALTK
jgi:hypothetical protein